MDSRQQDKAPSIFTALPLEGCTLTANMILSTAMQVDQIGETAANAQAATQQELAALTADYLALSSTTQLMVAELQALRDSAKGSTEALSRLTENLQSAEVSHAQLHEELGPLRVALEAAQEQAARLEAEQASSQRQASHAQAAQQQAEANLAQAQQEMQSLKVRFCKHFVQRRLSDFSSEEGHCCSNSPR